MSATSSPDHPLSAVRERDLARRARAGDAAARRRLVEANVGLVRWVAAAHRHHGVPFEDLVQEGCVGLLEAVDRFEPDRGVRLSTYAVFWIRSAVTRATGQAAVIRLPASATARLRRLRAEELRLAAVDGRWPSHERARRGAGLDVLDAACLDRATAVRLLEAPDTGAPVAVANGAHFPASSRTIDSAILERLLDGLPERHRVVVELSFGLGAREACTATRIAQELGCSRERVRQLRNEALSRLRGGLRTPSAMTREDEDTG